MKKTTKRICSILLICAMLFTLLPAMAFAMGEDAESQPSIMERVRAVIESVGTEVQGVGMQPLGAVVATGNTGGPGAAPWRLYDDGTMIVGSGHIQHSSAINPNRNPWYDHRAVVHTIIFEGTNTLGPSISNLFRAMGNLTTIVGMENWDTSTVTQTWQMFMGAINLTSLDLSNWDVSNVYGMQNMFQNTPSLTCVGDLSNWNTGNATNMWHMFDGASALTNLDSISNWDTSNVMNMQAMFREASGLTTLDLSNWDTGSVTNMLDMFASTNLTSVGDLTNWNTENVTNMRGMFRDTTGFTSLDLTGWDTSSVTDMGYMFRNSGIVTIEGTSGWNTENVTSMRYMFNRASNLTAIDLSSWNLGSLPHWSNHHRKFQFATVLRELTLGENFTFFNTAATFLPPVPDNANYPGYVGLWRNVGTGTVSNPQGTFMFTSNELQENFDGAIHADTWVWYWGPAPTANRIIQLNRSGVVTPLAPQAVGYVRAPRFSTVVQNVSDAVTGGLTVTISGPNASAFEIVFISREASIGVYETLPGGGAVTLDIPSLAVGNAANLHSNRRFLIQPVTGLAAGTYTARVTVSVDSDLTNQFDEYFDLVFVVQ